MLAAMADLSEKEGLFQVGSSLVPSNVKICLSPSGSFPRVRPSTPATMACSSSGSGGTASGSR